MTHTTKKAQSYCIGTKEIWENNSAIRKAYWNKIWKMHTHTNSKYTTLYTYHHSKSR